MRAVKILFLSFTCEDIGVAMVTNMSSQLQESFPLSRADGSFEISLIYKMSSRYDHRTVDFLDKVPNFDIDMFSEVEKLPARFTEVSENDVEKFIEGEENASTKKNDFLRLKISCKKVSVRRAPRNQRYREVSSN